MSPNSSSSRRKSGLALSGHLLPPFSSPRRSLYPAMLTLEKGEIVRFAQSAMNQHLHLPVVVGELPFQALANVFQGISPVLPRSLQNAPAARPIPAKPFSECEQPVWRLGLGRSHTPQSRGGVLQRRHDLCNQIGGSSWCNPHP